MKKPNESVVFKSVSGIVVLLVVFSAIVSVIGYKGFTDALLEQYSDGALLIADSAALSINADEMDSYKNSGGTTAEYKEVWESLDNLCNSSGSTFIYVIKPDLTDYAHITFLFSTINKDSPYTVYDFGYVRETTNDEYKEKYRALYDGTSDHEIVIRDKGYIETDAHITAMISLKGSDRQTKAILCVQRQMDDMTTARRGYVRRVILVLALLAVLIVIGQSFYLYRVFLRPIQKITNEAGRFAEENTTTDSRLTDKIHNKDEIGVLAGSIDKMEEQIVSYVENLTRVTAEKERISTELALATQIQASMLPNIFPPYPDRKDFSIFASMTPAKEVGGDFYDFFLIDDDHLGMMIADVSGKGVPAALFMMASKILLENLALGGLEPSEVLTKANEQICKDNKTDMFVTVWYGILEISTGKVRAANAGHEYPVLSKNGIFEIFKDKHGFVLGGMEGMRYRQYEFEMAHGDTLFVYTDGVPEATNGQNKMFGTDRLLEALNAEPSAEPKVLLENMAASVSKFVDNAEQFDDLTMLCVKRTYEAVMMKAILEVPALKENLSHVISFVGERLEEAGCGMKLQIQLETAVEEIFINIASYAYPEKQGSAVVEFSCGDGTAQITFTDQGIPFDPLDRADPDTTLPAEKRPIGGLGILMVKKMMDKVTYRRENGCNILTIQKSTE